MEKATSKPAQRIRQQSLINGAPSESATDCYCCCTLLREMCQKEDHQHHQLTDSSKRLMSVTAFF